MDHGFRKFHFTWCRHAGMDTLDIKWCQGRSLGVEDSYFKPNPVSGIYTNVLEGHDKRAGYLDAIDWLTIDNSKRLELENKTLRVQTSDIEMQKSDIEMLKKKVKEYDEFMAALQEEQRDVDALNREWQQEKDKKQRQKQKVAAAIT